jgi:toxin ParE1/3/4
MAHEVRVTERAYLDIEEIFAHIAQDSLRAAVSWREGVLTKIESLEHSPRRHGLAPEADVMKSDIRQTFFGVYRVLYRVEESAVVVMGVRHGARLPMRPEELPEN